jgi:molybdopterin converting factor small subunit
MTLITIPTPLRPFTEGQKELQVEGDTVGAVIKDLATRFPDLKQHLFNEEGDLRPYVNIFINQDDIRILDGENTPVAEGDRLMIVPSIAGGSKKTENLILVDHAAIRTNQSTIITLLLIAFIVDLPTLVFLTSLIMLLGALWKKPGFAIVYNLLKRFGVIESESMLDHSEPHLFAQGFGGIVLIAASIAFFGNFAIVGWGLTWLVVLLAALNLFGGFCVGCAVYYWFHRLGIPWFVKAPPEGRFPGLRPPKE